MKTEKTNKAVAKDQKSIRLSAEEWAFLKAGRSYMSYADCITELIEQKRGEENGREEDGDDRS